MRRRLAPFALWALAVVAVLFATPPVLAQPFPREDLPPELRPWVAWVLDQAPDLGCPRVRGQAVCLWPGRLRLDLGAAGGTFAVELHADRDAALRLPGSADRWPQDVTLDGRPAPVYDRDGSPHLRVGSGRHRVAGRFSWSRLPESLGVPPEIALVDLSLDGLAVPRLRREAGGLLWLRARADEAAGEGESLRLQVFRRVADGIPLFLETRLQLEVSGRAREITLPEALLPGSVAVAVSGDLPARVEKGALRVQVRGGRYAVTVSARVEGRPDALARPARPGPRGTDEREVWVFAADEQLRQVELSGPPAIDPSRTELPVEWRALPAFLMEPGARLAIATVGRGQPQAPPDVLQLARELWLDPDGRGASVRDTWSGTLHRTTRLDVLAPAALGRVAVDGQDQLITANPETKAAGVELRRGAVRLEADARLALGGALPAVGWSAGAEQLRGTLHLPPGWTLLGASGVDDLPGTWTSRWTLLGFFFVLIVAFAAHRLFGLRSAAVAAGTLLLTYGEPGAPFGVWLSLLAAIALRRARPDGRLGRLARLWFLASAAVLVILLVPFARDQVRDALFPQVAGGGIAPDRGVVGGVMQDFVGVGGRAHMPSRLPAAPPPPAPKAKAEPVQAPEETLRQEAYAEREVAEQKAPLKSGRYAYNVALEQDPKAVLQTGPGVPGWAWRDYSLAWTGPVGHDHRMRLLLASPGLNRLLTALRLALLGLLTVVVLTGRWPRLPHLRSAGPAAAVVALLLLAPAAVHAQEDEPATPSPRILEELKRRLTRPAPCEPKCVTTPSLRLRLLEGRLEVSAAVDAAADGTWAVPGPLGSWAAADLRVDGAPAVAIALLPDGFLHVRVPRGVHRLEAVGPVPPGDNFTLQFADPPRRARAEAPGWDVSGLRADGPAEPSILFARRLTARGAAGAAEGSYTPWLEVTRTLGFGVTWTVETRVRRVTPLGTPVAVRVPLLPGEAPTRANIVVEKGEAAVSLGRDEAETGWQSTLDRAPQLALRAPEGRPWSEVWRLQCSAIWSCAAEGLPPVSRWANGVHQRDYRPWPGESLRVALAHPQGIEGQTLTLDAVSLVATPGTRLERVQLSLSARSSREQPLLLRLPAAAEVQQVTLDGEERPLRPEAGELRLTVPAGAHTVEVRWQQARGTGLVYALPRVGLPGPAVNVSQHLTLPPNRWLLLTRGPAWGPAVLFWPYLVFLIAVASLLGRVPASPLSRTQWVLLGLGLSQIPAMGALIVAGFVFALERRRRRPLPGAGLFDLLQVVLVLWALLSLGLLYSAIQTGLLFRPDMQVAGNGSTDAALRWYADRVTGQTPAAGVVSLPLWVYRVTMLLWALWLAASLVRAVGWGWRALGEGGYWRPLSRRRARVEAAPAVPARGEDA